MTQEKNLDVSFPLPPHKTLTLYHILSSAGVQPFSLTAFSVGPTFVAVTD
jgi:hypothetical protein